MSRLSGNESTAAIDRLKEDLTASKASETDLEAQLATAAEAQRRIEGGEATPKLEAQLRELQGALEQVQAAYR